MHPLSSSIIRCNSKKFYKVNNISKCSTSGKKLLTHKVSLKENKLITDIEKENKKLPSTNLNRFLDENKCN